MRSLIRIDFGDGDVAEQLFMLKICALKNDDVPALWRLTESLMEVLIATARSERDSRWPRGYVTDYRLFDVPVDLVRELPHLLCENYMIYPYTVQPPRIWRHDS